jgi:hypothetical protein
MLGLELLHSTEVVDRDGRTSLEVACRESQVRQGCNCHHFWKSQHFELGLFSSCLQGIADVSNRHEKARP